jgi:hypothetical protein
MSVFSWRGGDVRLFARFLRAKNAQGRVPAMPAKFRESIPQSDRAPLEASAGVLAVDAA